MDTPIASNSLCLGALPVRHARYRPHHTAVIVAARGAGEPEIRLDWREFNAYVNRWANALARLGVTRGDRVASVLPNGLELLATYWAAGGWLHTGDLGYVDDDGFLYLVDRKKDMIDSGGVKVYPKDIEEIAAHHPAIREVAVFGIPHDKWGETPVAAVVLRENEGVDGETLKDWINARVAAKYQRLERVLILADFPRNAAGKTLKRELRAPFWAGRDRAI